MNLSKTSFLFTLYDGNILSKGSNISQLCIICSSYQKNHHQQFFLFTCFSSVILWFKALEHILADLYFTPSFLSKIIILSKADLFQFFNFFFQGFFVRNNVISHGSSWIHKLFTELIASTTQIISSFIPFIIGLSINFLILILGEDLTC